MKVLALAVLLITVLLPFARGAAVPFPPVLNVGDPAPDFTLPYATKDSIARGSLTLSQLFGKGKIVLAFYPADWSGGCTKEMCTLRDNFADLAKLDAEILGVSGDYQFSHHQWAKELNLPFKLLADHAHAVARAYGSYDAASGMNKRTVYVVTPAGKIAYIDLEYSTRDLASFRKLQDAMKQLH